MQSRATRDPNRSGISNPKHPGLIGSQRYICCDQRTNCAADKQRSGPASPTQQRTYRKPDHYADPNMPVVHRINHPYIPNRASRRYQPHITLRSLGKSSSSPARAPASFPSRNSSSTWESPMYELFRGEESRYHHAASASRVHCAVLGGYRVEGYTKNGPFRLISCARRFVMHPLFLRRFVRAIVASITFFLVCGNHLAAQQKATTTPFGSPLEMRLCVDNGCETLTWRDDHYAGGSVRARLPVRASRPGLRR